MLVEAVTYRFRGHSMADPEEYRTKRAGRGVAQTRPDRAVVDAAGRRRACSTRRRVEQIDERGGRARRRGGRVRRRLAVPARPSRCTTTSTCSATRCAAGTRSTSARRSAHRGEHEREMGRRARAREYDQHAAGPHESGDAPRPADEAQDAPRPTTASGAAADGGSCATARRSTQALREEMTRDERVFLMGEDIGVFNGAFKVTDGLLEEFGEARVRDTPISENTIVGMGVGAAMTGTAPGRRADDDQLLAARDRPDRQPRGAHPLHVRRPGRGAARRADAAGRRPPARARRTRTRFEALYLHVPGPARRRARRRRPTRRAC